MLENLLRRIISNISSYIRRLRIDAPAPSLYKKILSASIFFPLYFTFLYLCRIHLKLYGQLRFNAVVYDNHLFSCVLPDMVQRYIYLFGTWEPNVTAFIRSRLRPGDTFVDVGAHVGYYSIIASKLVGKKGRVIAIEPSPRLLDMLKFNISLNERLDNIIVVNKAVSDEPKNLDLFCGPENNLGMTTTRRRDRFPWETKVEANNLAEILQGVSVRQPRLIKIDIEGSEYEVMKTIKPFLEVCHEDTEFIVEISPEWWPERGMTFEAIFEPFSRAKYQWHIIQNNYKWWQYLWPFRKKIVYNTEETEKKLKKFKQLDILFTRNRCDENIDQSMTSFSRTDL